MSEAEAPAMTDAEEIKHLLHQVNDRLDRVANALNGLGSNVQWMLDTAKPLLEMVNSPMFGSMMPGMMSAAAGVLEDDGQ